MNAETPSARSQSRRVLSFIIAIALLAAALFAVSRHSDDLRQALKTSIAASPWLIAAALLLPALNWLIMSLSLWSLMNRFGRVPLGEMTCLIGAGWLLNYLPMRPGLLGRVAYHKAVHSIPIRDSVRASVMSIACAAAAIALMAPICLAAATSISLRSHILWIVVGPLIGIAAITLCLRGRPAIRILALNLGFRYADLLTWTCRYLVVFSLIGSPISWPTAGAVACVVQVAMLIPLTGNGLGLREWSVGTLSGVIPTGVLSSKGGLTTTTGLTADLLNRAAEVCCAVPVGISCLIILLFRKRH